jgi:DivIVA domain-containing protein
MPLTPADVHNVAFKKPPIGKRGYDEDEVDAFLDLVEAELARLIEENNDLKAQVEDLQRSGGPGPMRQVAPPPEPMAPPPPPPPVMQARIDENSQVVKVLAMAQETAEKYVADAKAEADRMVGEARATSERMIGEARNRAETMERDARGKAAALTQEAERKHNEIIGGLEQRKTTLEKRIEELRTFEREYRTRLKSYLESQLRDLEGRGSAEPATAAAGAGAYAGGYGMRADAGDGRGDS